MTSAYLFLLTLLLTNVIEHVVSDVSTSSETPTTPDVGTFAGWSTGIRTRGLLVSGCNDSVVANSDLNHHDNATCVTSSVDSSTSGPAGTALDIDQQDEQIVYWQMVAGIRWFTYASPILIVMATVGSVMSVIVLQNPMFRKSSTSFILSALAVVDGIEVNTGLMRRWILTLTSVDVRSFSSFSCKFHFFLTYYAHQVVYANWHCSS